MSRALLIAAAVAIFGALAAAAMLLRGTAALRWMRDPRNVVKPGALAPLHEAVEELADCDECHSLDTQIPNAKCYSCHGVIQQRRRKRKGYHGKILRGMCLDCHADHKAELVVFDQRTFNHELALFALRGRHTELPCEKCHEKPTGVAAQPTRLQYIGIRHDACTDCHEDPHTGTLQGEGRACTSCHDESGWSGLDLRFAHDRDATFRLEGEHVGVACTECHVPPEGSMRLADAALASTGTACADCHADPHAGQFPGTSCETCHTPRGFKGEEVRFRHASHEAFRLDGAHAQVACDDCHRIDAATGARRFRDVGTACASCHEDPHGGQFTDTTCASCHQARGFRDEALLFDHRALAAFPLGGKHVTVPCAKCHTPPAAGPIDAPATFRGRSRDCAACHEDPHGGQFAQTTCASCHRDTGFGGNELAFRHADLERFPLTGAHAAVACADCHTPAASGTPQRFRDRGTTCDSCHEDPHTGSSGGKECARCHTTAGWKGTNLTFDHGRDAAFALDVTHAGAPCAACHEPPRFAPLPTDCATCHDAVSANLAGRIPGATPKMSAAGPHAELVTCTQCHAPGDRNAAVRVIAARCAACHNQRYAKLALDRQALLDDLLLRGRAALDRAATSAAEETESRRARLDALHRAAAHDFAPATRSLRTLVETLERDGRN